MSLRVNLRKRFARSRRRSIFLVPFLFTFGNALCGFLSIIRSIEGDALGAAYYIILAALMDLLDGRLARAFGAASTLGMELDSLCDAVSFCLAPAIAVYSWHHYEHSSIIMCALVAYLCAGLFRLAKFNVLSRQQKSYFLGLPTTLGALLIANVIVYESFLVNYIRADFFVPEHLCVFLVLIGFLMISTIRFPSGKYVHFSRIAKCMMCILNVGMIGGLLYEYPVALFVLVTYVVGSILMNFWRVIRQYRQP